jgi:hypothetical protein
VALIFAIKHYLIGGTSRTLARRPLSFFRGQRIALGVRCRIITTMIAAMTKKPGTRTVKAKRIISANGTGIGIEYRLSASL